MNCNNCGTAINPGTTICPNCGNPITGSGNPQMMPNQNNMTTNYNQDSNMMNQQMMPNQNNIATNYNQDPNMMNQQMMPNQNNMATNYNQDPNMMNPQMMPNQNNIATNYNQDPNMMNQQMMPNQNNMATNYNQDPNMMNQQMMPNQNNMATNYNQDPNMMNQQMMPNQDFEQPQLTEEKPKKKVSPLIIILLIVLVGVLIWAGPYWYDRFFGGEESEGELEVVEQNTIEILNYRFIVPEGFVSEKQENRFILTNGDYVLICAPTYTRFSDIKDNIKDVKALIQSEKITVDNTNSETYENREYLLFSGKYDNMAVEYSYTAIDENNSLQVVAFKDKDIETFDRSHIYIDTILKNISVLKNQTDYKFSINNLGIGEIDINDIKTKLETNVTVSNSDSESEESEVSDESTDDIESSEEILDEDV